MIGEGTNSIEQTRPQHDEGWGLIGWWIGRISHWMEEVEGLEAGGEATTVAGGRRAEGGGPGQDNCQFVLTFI